MKPVQQILACLFFVALTIKEGKSNLVITSACPRRMCHQPPQPMTCYSCNSFIDPDCEKIVDKKHEVPCSANQTICRKVEQHIYYNKQDHVRVFRQCATRGTPGDCDTRTGTYRFKTWYCHCSGPNCNGSGSLMAPIVLTVSLVCAGLGLRTWL